jgi:hypothetical protein
MFLLICLSVVLLLVGCRFFVVLLSFCCCFVYISLSQWFFDVFVVTFDAIFDAFSLLFCCCFVVNLVDCCIYCLVLPLMYFIVALSLLCCYFQCCNG